MNGEVTVIRDLKPGMKNMNIVFIILEMSRPNVTKEGHEVRTCKVADKSGSVNVSLWDEPGQLLQSGDICKLTKGYSSLWKGCLTLYCGKGGEILKIGEFCLVFSECPFMSEPNAEYLQSQQGKMQPIEPRSLSPTSQMLLGGPPPLSPLPSNQGGPEVRPPLVPGGGNGVSANLPAVPFQRNNRSTPPLPPSVAPSGRAATTNHTNGVNNVTSGRRIIRR